MRTGCVGFTFVSWRRVLPLAPLFCWTPFAPARSAEVPPAPSPLPVLRTAEAAARLPSNASRQTVGDDVYADPPRRGPSSPIASAPGWMIRDNMGCIGMTNAFGRWRFPVDGTVEVVRLPRSMRIRPPAGGAGWELTARGPLVVETQRGSERGPVSVRLFRNTPCFELRMRPDAAESGIRIEFPAAAANERSSVRTGRGPLEESAAAAVVPAGTGWAVVEADGFALALWPLDGNRDLHLRRDGPAAWLASGAATMGFALVGPGGGDAAAWSRASRAARAGAAP